VRIHSKGICFIYSRIFCWKNRNHGWRGRNTTSDTLRTCLNTSPDTLTLRSECVRWYCTLTERSDSASDALILHWYIDEKVWTRPRIHWQKGLNMPSNKINNTSTFSSLMKRYEYVFWFINEEVTHLIRWWKPEYDLCFINGKFEYIWYIEKKIWQQPLIHWRKGIKAVSLSLTLPLPVVHTVHRWKDLKAVSETVIKDLNTI
jgi:hypothetical protein